MKSYSDIRRAVRQPQYQPGQPARTFTHQHQSKRHSRYPSPQIIQRQVGPSTYELSDGRKWNGSNLTKTNIYARIEEDDWDDDSPTPHPESSTFSSAMPPLPPAAPIGSMSSVPPAAPVTSTSPVPPTAPVSSMSHASPATPVRLQSPDVPVYKTPPLSPMIPDTHPGPVFASPTDSESFFYWCLPYVVRVRPHILLRVHLL